VNFSYPSLAEIGDAAWDDLVRSSPDGWVFSLAGWQRLVRDVAEWGFLERGFGIMEGSRLRAIVPFHFRPQHGVSGSSGWGGSGPVIIEGLSNAARESVFAAAIARMLDVAQADGASRLELSCSPVTGASLANRWGVNPFVFHGFEDLSRLSQVIDLSVGKETLWSGLSKTARQAVRKAEKAGYRVERVDWSQHVDAYYDCHRETYQRTGVAPHPRDYFAGMAAHTAPAGASVLFAAFSPQGEPIAYHNDARLDPGANYHTGCSRNAARQEGLDYLLMWYAILDAHRSGLSWYDCGWIFPGATDPKQQGLTLFKTRFGGEPHRAFAGQMRLLAPVQEPAPAMPPAKPSLLQKLTAKAASVLRARS
jgi:hypothetical protein